MRDRLIATSVTLRGNERALRVAFSDYALEEGQQTLRKTETGLFFLETPSPSRL